MVKSRKSKSIVKSLKNKTLPAVNSSLKAVGSTAQNVAKSSIPVIEKGVSVVYGTMATGLDLGMKGVKKVAKGVTKYRRSSRSRKTSRGRKTRRH